MICYICAEHASNSVRVHDTLTVSYCDEHSQQAAIGISEFALKGRLDRLEQFKADYLNRGNGAAVSQFEKCKAIDQDREFDDSGITEQPI